MKNIFSGTLTKLRKEAGFDTAYSFFHNNGGKSFLKASYRMYLLMEQGKLLPPFQNLILFAHALRINLRSSFGAEFIAAWLKDKHGEDNFRDMIEPFFKTPKEESVSTIQKAHRKLMSRNKYFINHRQLAAITRDRTAYLCWTLLSNDTSAWTAEALAAEMGVAKKEAERTIRDLTGVKLLKRIKGAYKCPMAGSTIDGISGDIISPDIHKRFTAFHEELIASGVPVYMRLNFLRASLTELSNFFPVLDLNTTASEAYGITKKQKDSALFEIAVKVVKMRDF